MVKLKLWFRNLQIAVCGRLAAVWIMCAGSFFACEKPQQAIELPEQVSFNFHIRPILSNNCYVCHGPDSSTRKADLRLDIVEGATRRLADGKRAIAPGNWRQSEMIHRVMSTDPEYMMPPPEMKKHLSEREIGLLKKWIAGGAVWEPYWAYVPPKQTVVPSPDQLQYSNNDIDNYLVKKLENNQLTPGALTNRSNLIRRLSYVMTGLPPTPQMVRDFERDLDPKAYESLVDEMLASPHFGERWARHWMDLVRYADSRGHEFDYEIIGVWRYRDYLIRAFNADVPYDLFVTEHLAGDLLDQPRIHPQQGFNESVLGTAFYCLSEGKHSPVDIREDEAERIDNIIDVTTKTFQALTVGCAKCHDHKFDPIPTTDYYSLYGIVESTRFSLVPAAWNKNKMEVLDSIKEDLQQLRSYIGQHVAINPSDFDPVDQPVAAKKPVAGLIGDFRKGDLQGWFSSGVAFENALGMPILEDKRVIGLESGKASSKVYGKGLQGALRSPTFIISHDSLLIRASGKHSTARVIIDNFQLIQDPIYGRLRIHPEDEHMHDFKIDLSMWKGHKAFIELQAGNYGQKTGKGFHSYDIRPDAWLEVEYVIAYDSLLKVPESTSAKAQPTKALQNWLAHRASPHEVAWLNDYFRTHRPSISGIHQKKRDLEQKAASLYDSIYVVGVTHGDVIESPVFIRGSHQNLSKWKVPHRFFTALSDTTETFTSDPRSRLRLAQKIVDPENPLTARVMVNRIWQYVFGRGIVETVDNFGLQGQPPTHPELLDDLALKFMEQGWSVKTMIKYMVMSQAFQRVTTASPESLDKDPQNLLLQHYPVRRMDAESIRDAILAVSGRLDSTMYGPPVALYLTQFLDGRGRPVQSGPLDGAGRRSIYQDLRRNFLPPMMLAFDMPIPFSTFGRRNVSNVPAQSLTLMNDPFVIDQARYWARQVVSENTDFDTRVNDMYIQAFSRLPDQQEKQQAREFFSEIKGLRAEGTYEELELWQDYCHSIFNMKEFIFLI